MRALLFVITSLILTGCATARLPKGPESHALILYENAGRIGVPRAADERKGENIGTIGGAVIKVRKYDLVELATNYLVYYINEKIKLNVVRVTLGESDPAEVVASAYKVDGLLVMKIKELKMFSIEALMQQVKTDLTLELMVFDASGVKIYNRVVTSHHEKRIGVSIVENSTGKIVEAVVKGALKQYGKDPELRKIIAKFRYGSLARALKIPSLG